MKITIRVKPGSKKGPLVQPNLIDNSLIVYVREPAIDGKANKAVIALLSEYYDIPKTHVEIIHGHTARVKTVHIAK